MIYTYFADAASQNINLYSTNRNFYSSVIAARFGSGGPQEKEGIAYQRYADYPPPNMRLSHIVFSLLGYKGLYYVYIVLLVSCFLTYPLLVKNLDSLAKSTISDRILFVFFLGSSPLRARHCHAKRRDFALTDFHQESI